VFESRALNPSTVCFRGKKFLVCPEFGFSSNLAGQEEEEEEAEGSLSGSNRISSVRGWAVTGRCRSRSDDNLVWGSRPRLLHHDHVGSLAPALWLSDGDLVDGNKERQGEALATRSNERHRWGGGGD